MRPELRHLRAFVAVAEELGFNRAAERLHVTQPSLSQQIRQLEKDLGVELVHRTTRRVEPTSAGYELLDRARRILRAVDEAFDAAGRASRGEVGRLSVGFTGTATYELLPTMARVFRSECPDVELALSGELLTPAQVDALLAGTLDIGFLRPPVEAAELAVEVVRREPLAVALPERHPLTAASTVPWSALESEPFIAHPNRSVVYQTMLRACLAAGFHPRIVQEAAQTSVVVSLVAAGIGVALIPESVKYIQVTGTAFRRLEEPTAHIELGVAWRHGDDSPLVQRFLTTARRVLADRQR